MSTPIVLTFDLPTSTGPAVYSIVAFNGALTDGYQSEVQSTISAEIASTLAGQVSNGYSAVSTTTFLGEVDQP